MKKLLLNGVRSRQSKVQEMRTIIKKNSEFIEHDIDYSKYSFKYASVNPDGTTNGPFRNLNDAMEAVGQERVKIQKNCLYESSAVTFKACEKEQRRRKRSKATLERDLAAMLKELEDHYAAIS